MSVMVCMKKELLVQHFFKLKIEPTSSSMAIATSKWFGYDGNNVVRLAILDIISPFVCSFEIKPLHLYKCTLYKQKNAKQVLND